MTGTAAALLATLWSRGVALKANGNRLFFCPAAAVPPDLRAALVRHKTEFLALLAPPPSSVPPNDPPVERLLAQGVGRGEIWTRAEFQILSDLTPAGARTLTLAKRLFDGEVIRPPESSGASERERPLRLDPTTVSDVLGPASADPAEVVALEAEVRAAVVHAHDEFAMGIHAPGVLQVRDRPLADYLDLDTIAQLLRATPEAQRLLAALAHHRRGAGARPGRRGLTVRPRSDPGRLVRRPGRDERTPSRLPSRARGAAEEESLSMATYRRLESGGSGIWKPKDRGSSIEGVFEGRELGEYGQLLLFQGVEGVPWKVPMTSRLEQIAGHLQEGVTYKLTFNGRIDIGGGKTVKDIVVDELVDEDDEAPASATAVDESPF